MKNKSSEPIFDYDTIWLITGIIAFALPIVVLIAANFELNSISESYCKGDWPRNFFVGFLFIVGTLLFIIKGFEPCHKWLFRVPGFAAFGVALFAPCKDKDMTTAIIHAGSALILFVALALICFFVFSPRASGKSKLNFIVLGWFLIVLSMFIVLVHIVPIEIIGEGIVYALESILLWIFACAWILAYKNESKQRLTLNTSSTPN